MILFRFLVWFFVVCLICWPLPIHIDSYLLGDSDVDVWNHAWGYWYVAQAISNGTMPLETELVGAPNGGILYYIDAMGATLSYPITHFFGPGIAYNITLLIRIALAALGAQYLCRELTSDGIHTWIAGLAYATTPFLLCELGNGISEVCAIQWIAWTFWAFARVLRRGYWKDWLLLGIFQGCTTTATFYYGLTSAVIIIPILIAVFLKRFLKGKKIASWLLQAVVCVLTGLVILAPHAYFFWTSLHSTNRLIMRDTSLNAQLLRHNAVDPFVFIRPGNYQSVDLLQEYGEPFVHTGYLRWTVLLLLLFVPFQKTRYRLWIYMGIFSLIMGLGSYLWIDGEWFLLQGKMLSLPFNWLQQILPQIAITHPLRLSIVGQLIFAVFAGIGCLYARRKVQQIQAFIFIALLLVVESFGFSSASWPIPTSPAHIPKLYESDFQGYVLDLPAEVGTTMKTSQYFWMQTIHQKPIPYTPDVRIGSARDFILFQNFIGEDGISEQPRKLSKKAQEHIMQKYGLVVLHSDLSVEMTEKYKSVFMDLLGEPKQENEKYYWIVPKDIKKKITYKLTALSNPCDNARSSLNRIAQVKGDTQRELIDKLDMCLEEVSGLCLKQSLRKEVSSGEIKLCLKAFKKHPQNGDIEVMTQILQRQETAIRLLSAKVLQTRKLTVDEKRRIERAYHKERIPKVRQELQYFLP